MSSINNIEFLEAQGYDIVQSGQIFGRGSQLMSGEPLFEGGYRAVDVVEIFGSGSTVGHQVAAAALEPSFAYTSVYQLLVVVGLVLYLNMLLRSWGFMGAVLGDIFSLHSERRMAGEGGELPLSFFKVLAILVGIIMLALVAVRIADVNLSAGSSLYLGSTLSVVPLISLVVVTVVLAWLYLLHLVAGWISQSSVVAELQSVTTINFVRYVVLFFPVVATWLVASPESVHMWGIVVICGTILLLIIYLKDTFVFFIAKKIPFLYWILYLCTAFLLPISFVLTMLPAEA